MLRPSVVRARQVNLVSVFLYSPGSQYSQTAPTVTRKMLPPACQEPRHCRLWVRELLWYRVPLGHLPVIQNSTVLHSSEKRELYRG